MSILNFVLLSYGAKRLASAVLVQDHFNGWTEELLDFAYFSAQKFFLGIFWTQNPQLSIMDIMSISYPYGLLWDALFRNEPMLHWKVEARILVGFWIIYFLMEIFVQKIVVKGIHNILDPELLWWLAIFACTWGPAMKLFPPIDDNEDE
ncbi:hypothetical protein Ddc_09619 [Ditylenchus destructor]|nr:hypothetical protein Ddc_09619 [Ditylenchus destructor]